MRELSIFADESGDKTAHSRYFILTLVLHKQESAIAENMVLYEAALDRAGLPNIPFHSEPLLNGHKEYSCLTIEQRKRLLVAFSGFVRGLPVRYKSFVYKADEFDDEEKLLARMKRDIAALLFEHLAFFQGFDHVKIYYDNGQSIVQQALDQSVSFMLSKQAVIQRRTTMTEYRLAQVSDFLCTIELAALKYENAENGGTYDKFFGTRRYFVRNWLKEARRKSID